MRVYPALWLVFALGLNLAVGQTSRTWNGSVSSDWFNATNWTPSGVPAANDTINVNSSAGTINLSAPVTVSGQFNWLGGTLTGSPLTISTTGALNLLGNGSITLGVLLTNAGTINWSNTVTWYVYNNNASYNGAIYNLATGLLNIQSDQGMNGGYCCPFFNNAGTVSKGAGSGTTTFNVAFTNTGIVTASAGTLTFNGGADIDGTFNAAANTAIYFNNGTFNSVAPPTLNGPGTFQFSGGRLTLASNTIPNLHLTGGTLSLGPGFQGGTITNLTLAGANLSGNNTVSGQLNWSSGNINGNLQINGGATVFWSGGGAVGPVNIAANGVLNLVGNNSITLYAALTNAGTINWSNSLTWYVYNNSASYSGAVYNLPTGLLNIESDQGMNGGYCCPFLYNQGTITKGANTGTTVFSVGFTNTGVVTALKGSIVFNSGGDIDGTFNASATGAIYFNSGAFSYVTPPTLNGPGTIQFSGGSLTLASNTIPNLQLTGGTLSLGPGFQGGTITNLTLAGANLSGNNTVSGQLNWSAGNVNGNLQINGGATVFWSGGNALGPVNIAANGVLNLVGNSSVTLYAALTNAGTINWSNSLTWYVYNNNANYNGAVFNLATGLLNIQSDAGINGGYCCPLFNNAGTITKGANTGTTTFNLGFTNSGVVTALKGNIVFNSGGDIDGTFNASATGAIYFNSGAFSYVTPPTLNGPGTIQFSGGTLTLASNTIPNLQLTGGTLSLGPGFQGGTITNLTTSATVSGNLIVSGTFNCSGGVNGNVVVTNGGTLNFSGGNLQGSLQLEGGGTANWSSGGAVGPVNIATNAVLDLVGNGSMTIYAPLTNAGTINWMSGTWYVYNNNAAYTGAIYNLANGLVDIESDSSLSGGYCCPFFNNAGAISKGASTGTTSFNLAFTNNGVVTALQGAFNFNSGGQLQGIFNAVAGTAIDFNGGNFSFAVPPTLNGPGTIQLTGGTLTVLNSLVPNLGLAGGSLIVGTNFQGGTITNLTTSATLTGDLTVSGVFNCGGGVTGNVVVTNGGTLNFSGGNISGNLTLDPGATVNWSGGNVNGNVLVPGGAVLNWSGGGAFGPLNIATNGILNLVGNGSETVYAPLTNSGTINWSSGYWYVYNNNAGYTGAIYNLANGLLNIEGDWTLIGGYCCPFFNNQGTISKGAGTGATSINVVLTNSGLVTTLRGSINFNSGGDIDGTFTVAAGTAINFSGGNFSFNAAPAISGAGAVQFTGGNLTLSNSLVPNLALLGGNLTVGTNFQGGTITNLTSGATLGGNFTVSGLFNCAGGVNGNVVVANGGTLNFSGGTISGNLGLNNGATVNWTSGNVNGSVLVGGGALLNWSGGGAFGPVNIATNGVFNLVGNGSETIYAPLTNAGTINWSSGYWYVYNNNAGYTGAIYNQANGLFNIESDWTLIGGYCCPFFNNAGIVRKSAGVGTTSINVQFTNINALDIETGTVRFNTAFSQTGGTWTLGLNGPANYGQIAFANGVALGGSLTVNLNNGYVPGINSSFALVTYPSQTGSFASVTLPPDGLFWQLAYGAGAVNLTATNYIAPVVSITTPTNGAAFTAPANITLTATATDANAAVTNVEYFLGTNSVGRASSSPYSVALNNVQPGFYSLTAKATDAVGASSLSSPVSINVYSPINPSTNYFWVGTSSSDWFNPTNWNPAGVPGTFDVANITNGATVTISNNVTLGSLNLSSGTINGPWNLIVSNTFNWTAGTLASALTLPSAATLNLMGNGTTLYLESALTNAGTVNWSSGTLNLYSCGGPAGPIMNLAGGTWNLQGDQTLNQSCGSANAFFQNSGTVRKLVTAGTSVFSVPFNNSGQVTAQSGTISFNGGGSLGGSFAAASGTTIDFSGGSFAAAGATVSGAGFVQFNGGTLTLGTDAIANVALTGGTLMLGPAFQGGTITNLTLAGSTLAGTNTVTGTMNCPAGIVGGPLTIASTGVLNLNGSGTVYVEAPLTNGGTVNWTGGTITVYGCSGAAGPIVNLAGAQWNVLCDQTMNQSCVSASSYFANAGTVKKSSSTGVTYFSLPFNNTGVVTALSGTLNFNGGGTLGGTFAAGTGTLINFSAGAFSSSGNVAINGPGTVQLGGGTLTLSNNPIANLPLIGGTVVLSPTFQGGTITNLTVAGSTLAGTNVVTGTLNLSGTTITGPLTIANNGVLNLIGNGTLYVENTLTNSGMVNWLGGPVVLYGCGGPAGPIVNLPSATWSIQCDQTMSLSCGSASAVFQNAGTVQKSLTLGTTYFSLPFINSGILAPQNGTLDFNGTPGYASAGGTLDYEVSSLSGAGHVTIAGGISFDGTLVVNAVNPYVPKLGDALSLVSYNSRTGAIPTLSLPSVGPGLAWQVSYTAKQLLVQVTSAAGLAGQITGSVTDNLGHPVSNVVVFAYTTNASAFYVNSRTDTNGNYVLNVNGGAWQLGLQGLPALGFNNVPLQTVLISNNNPVVNFVLQPFTGQTFTITTSVNPQGAGTASGGGTFAPGAGVTVTAIPNTSTLPWLFASWTENGVFESPSSSYSFSASRDRQLVANFTLPLYTISVTNVPTGAGTVTGAGSYYYGTTNVLTAYPNFGYNFGSWMEGTNTVGLSPTLTTVVYSNHAFTANYTAANLTHVVTTATSPSGLATVAGAGTYTNGQTANFSAPASITNAPFIYTFQQYTVSNVVVSFSPSFSKTFSTLDQTNLQYVAVYTARAILPVVTRVTPNFVNPVPATTNFLLTLQFDRSMQTNVSPLLTLTNSAATLQPSVQTNGSWSSSSLANDTYTTPPITFLTGMDGTNQLFVSGGQDLSGGGVALTNAGYFIVDATPPAAPVLSVVSSNSGSILVAWSNYVAPNDLSSFRIYLQTSNFSSVAGLPILTGLGASARNVQVGGLILDTPYYIAVQAVDLAGNGSGVNPLAITLPSSVPPPVTVQQSPVGASSALVSWNGYNTAGLLGFAGFQLFYRQTNFSSVLGMVPDATLDSSTRAFQVNGLDRSKSYYFAVVGFNGKNGFNPAVTTVSWSDPYAGNISANLVIGSGGQNVVTIYQSMTVINNATLTIQPGTTLLFMPGTSLAVQTGNLMANGTALAPIIFDSANDSPGNNPAPGDWQGVVLGTGAGGSSLNFVQMLYGSGLTLIGCSPTVQAFTASYNSPYGLGLKNGATLTTRDALLTANDIGAEQFDTAVLTVGNSVIKNNGTNAMSAGFSAMSAVSNWWGTAVQAGVAGGLQGAVSYTPFLTFEPLLTPALGTQNGVTQVGSASVNLALACRTAVGMRVSEDDTFPGIFFAPFTNFLNFPLSAGGGIKHIFAQYRSVTGQTNAPVQLDVNRITAGPVIQSFNLTEGQVLSRPMTVTGSAYSPLGVADLEFYLDGVLAGTNAGGNLSQYLDVRTLANSTHRVELLARDTSGNIATLANNVFVSVTPPPAPNITSPAGDYSTNNANLTLSGVAEAGIGLQLTDNGQVLGTTNANAAGQFTFNNLTLVEGANTLTAVAADSTGSTPSPARHVTVSTIPPAALVMNSPTYTPGAGLALSWQFPTVGKRAASFQLFWGTSAFATTNQATGHSIVLQSMSYSLQGLANGTYYFGVVGFDGAGNSSPLSALVSTVYDASPPALSVSYTAPSPTGVGTVGIILSSSKPLAVTPTLTLQPAGAASPISLNLTNVAVNTYQTAFSVTPSTPAGLAALLATAQDQFGNVFNGAPTGAPLIIDTVPPAANITTAPPAPVKTVNNTNVAVNVALTKLVVSSPAPTLTFTPPVGAVVPVPLTGAGSNWNGTLSLTSAMGSGFGRFAFSAQDGVANVGTNILSGAQLELYNTALPSAPAAPTNLVATSLAGGFVRLDWNSVSNAQIYRLYREPGTNLVAPSVLDLDNITSNSVVDLPSTNGAYRYGVTASRLGSESGISNVVIGVSDSIPPAAPTNVTVTLAASGVQVTWQEPSGGKTPDHYNIYRNGTLIQRVSSITPVTDYPPRGTNLYVVGASDKIGNENPSTPFALALLVGAVDTINVSVTAGQAPTLTWVSTDPTAVGFNLYRNGIKQNASLLVGTSYTDNLPASDVVQYAVTAVNASAQESPPRLVSVYPVGFGLLVNSQGSGTNNPVLQNYFDQVQVTVSNLSQATPLSLSQVQLSRIISAQPTQVVSQVVSGAIGAGMSLQQTSILAEAPVVAPQTFQVQAFQQTDSSGSRVTYFGTFNLNNSQLAATEIAVTVNQLPLAGGLTPFQVQVYNRGYTDIQLIVSRGFGAHPGDFYISVQNGQGQEVSRTTFQGTPPGTFFLADGTGYINIPIGASTTFTVPQVLVPAALAGSTNTTFVAVAATIYNQFGTANQLSSGPLSGSMVSSSLALPPYYGSAKTDKSGYGSADSITITGQALNTSNSLPVPNAPLHIGFATRGFHWFQDITADTNGNYQYIFNPPVGFAGSLSIWAAHPLVVDQLNQAQVTVSRVYSLPPSGDITMSKNDTLDFSIQLFNPGDLPLSGFATTFNAYQVSGTNLTPISTITGTNLAGPGFSIAPGEKKTIALRLAASISAPDTAETDFTFTSAEGATITFSGSTTLLPAVPVLTVETPAVGYLEVSVNRGTQLSGQVTVQNTGLRPLQGITLTQPTNSWISVNLPASPDGQIHLPDLGVGQSNTFTVVFTPPTNTDLAFYQDAVTIQGTNAASPFKAGVYALVTSDLTGAVQFFVDDILGSPVPQAAVRLHNNVLFSDPPAVYTDTNGLVTITNLQEGSWDWQIVAAGCSASIGTVDIVPDQTIYHHTRLSRSLVTVTFNVVPVPFTDQYQIQVEQTFETHVPAGVLVVTPPFLNFPNVTPGFTANFIATVENYGLIQMTDVTINGAQVNGLQLTPLITYVPVLLPMQSVPVPFVLTYNSSGAPAGQGRQVSGGDIANCIAGGFPFGGLVDPAVFEGLAAIFNAQERCYTDLSPQDAAAALGILAGLGIAAGSFAEPLEVLANYLGSTLGCIVGQFLNFGGGGGPGGGGPSVPSSGSTFEQAPGCFAPETLVLMADGTSKPISEVRTNDIVRTGLRQDNVAEVNAVLTQVSLQIHRIILADAVGKPRTALLATEEHLLWVDGKGWTAVANLKPGDWLLDSSGARVQVKANTKRNETGRVYTLSLSGDNAFYADNVLVRDACGVIPPTTSVKLSEVRQ